MTPFTLHDVDWALNTGVRFLEEDWRGNVWFRPHVRHTLSQLEEKFEVTFVAN